ncbi:maltose alpha-D-glucosyltransferase/alpha-amylase [Pseudomonas sp. IAP-CY TE4608]
MLLAEANQWPEDTRPYFGEGDGDECHMAFHFPLMPRMYMALAMEDRFPITDILRQTPEIPANCQWAIFLRNHDELTLEMVTDRERDYLWNYYAEDRRARINLGIRRRLAPLLQRDRRRIELLTSLLLSMPGTPTLYYGDELGMGDNIYLGDRDGVRTPMQWSPDRNGGFSRADPQRLVLPPIMDPLYGYQTVNVEAQSHDPHSLLNWTRRMLAVRKQQKAFGRGSLRTLTPSNRRILAYIREYTDADGNTEVILCVANVSRAAQAAELELSQFADKVPVEMLGGSAFPPIGQLPFLLTLPPYAFYWFLLASRDRMPSWHIQATEGLPELTTLVLRKRMEELLQAPASDTLQSTILPQYLPKRRWFAGKEGPIDAVRLCYGVRFGTATTPVLLSEIEVLSDGTATRYQLPFGLLREEQIHTALPQQLALSRVRRTHQVGLITDAFVLEPFIHAVMQACQDGLRLPCGDSEGELRFECTEQLAGLALDDESEVRYLSAEQSNSSVVIGDRVVLKLIRRVNPGIHPELEMSAYLTAAGFANISPLLAWVSRVDEQHAPHLLMIAQGYLSNQGDAWGWTQNTLERAIRDQMEPTRNDAEAHTDALAELSGFAALLGQRLGEMHLLLAAPTEDPAFQLRPSDARDSERWRAQISTELTHALDLLAQHRDTLDSDSQSLVDDLQQQRDGLAQHIDTLSKQAQGGLLMRVHGDLHLGQVLVVQGDAYLIDFEGEPARPLEERRAKHSPYKDVSGVLRSFDYAAAMILRSASAVDLSEPARQARQRVARQYLHQSRHAFVEAYGLATAAMPHAWQHAEGERAALELFCLEKAAYEITYEAENRPSWLAVPLHGLHGLISTWGESE